MGAPEALQLPASRLLLLLDSAQPLLPLLPLGKVCGILQRPLLFCGSETVLQLQPEDGRSGAQDAELGRLLLRRGLQVQKSEGSDSYFSSCRAAVLRNSSSRADCTFRTVSRSFSTRASLCRCTAAFNNSTSVCRTAAHAVKPSHDENYAAASEDDCAFNEFLRCRRR